MTFMFVSLGCKVNSYETSALRYKFLEHGLIEDKNNPDIIVINTCSVTAVADQKSRQNIRKMKRIFPNAIIVVMGCYSQKSHVFISKEIRPDIVIGTSKRSQILNLIDEVKNNNKKIDATDDQSRLFEYEELGIASLSENVRAYLKIQDGCDNFCSYCLIPYVRGKSRSRNFEDIIQEARFLTQKGYKEIVLTGIHVGGYGHDNSGKSFSDLVETILKIEGLNRLRISSIEESEIDDKLIYLLSNNNKLAKHLHIPLQSGCDATLKRMNRKYTCEQFLTRIKQIRSLVPDVCITTDVIVGFPNETEDEFNETYKFIKQCDFNMLHVFPYSSREGTIASKMDGQVIPNIKKERCDKLLKLSEKLWEDYSESFIGKDIDILVEEKENDFAIGRASNYLHIKFLDSKAIPGDIVKIKIQKDMILSK